MPQPLSKVRPKAYVDYANLNIPDNDHITYLVCSIIARWARTEFTLSHLMMFLVEGNDSAALSIYNALQSDSAKEGALLAAASAVLKGDELATFNAVILALKPIAKTRNKLAHWYWCSSPDLRDCLLLANPAKIRKQFERWNTLHRRSLLGKEAGGEPDSSVFKAETFFVDPESVLVFDLDELESADLAAGEANTMLAHLQMYLRPIIDEPTVEAIKKDGPQKEGTKLIIEAGTSAAALQRLSKLPRFREALERVRDQTKNSPQAPA